MKKELLYAVIIITGFASCQKEYSDENGGDGGAGVIIGADCRISKIAYADSATGVSIGSTGATIDGSDVVTDITIMDSLTLTIDFNSVPAYFTDTVYIDPDQYFIAEAGTKRIKSLHGLIDPTVPGSQEFDITYNYDASGYLTSKSYTYTSLPTIPFETISYTYAGGNLTHMTAIDEFTTNLIKDADITYYNNIAPKNFIYLFPDEDTYAPYNQFYNFGKKPLNAVKNLKVRFYDPGNVLVDSAVSNFSSYVMSRDNYVLSTYMIGDDQSSIPAAEGKLSFSYKCK